MKTLLYAVLALLSYAIPCHNAQVHEVALNPDYMKADKARREGKASVEA